MACNAIVKNMTPQDVYEDILDKEHQKDSIICQINEIILKSGGTDLINLNDNFVIFLSNLLRMLEDN